MKFLINIGELIDSFQMKTFIAGNASYSYTSFFDQVCSVAANLRALGVKKGSKVIIHNVQPQETVFLVFAITSLKAIVFPLNPKTNSADLIGLKLKLRASFVISKKSYGDEILQAFQVFKKTDKKTTLKKLDWEYSLPAVMILTSGSSGKPKIAVHSLNSLFFNAKFVNTYFGLNKEHSWLLSLPLYHISGLAIIFRCLISGARLIIPKEKTGLNGTIEQFRPTHLSLVATQLWRLLEKKQSIKILKSCEAIFLGGSAIPQTLIKKALKNDLHIFTSYGLTETASTVAIKKVKNTSTDNAEILPSFQVKISKDNEIQLKGRALFLGYYIKRNVKAYASKKGWYSTGDLGSLNGNLITVFGRKDNMIISGGENIYPEEIEKHLLMIDKIEKALVVAVENKEYGQRPVAFIQKAGQISDAEIIEFLKRHLLSYKIPDRFLMWPEKYSDNNIKLKRHYFTTLI